MIIDLSDVRPKCIFYGYSNEFSQNALLSCTKNFPSKIDSSEFSVISIYSDRLSYSKEKELKEFIGCGDQGWYIEFKKYSDHKLKELAKICFDLTEKPVHVRTIFCFNTSNGYSCPVIQAIIKAKEA